MTTLPLSGGDRLGQQAILAALITLAAVLGAGAVVSPQMAVAAAAGLIFIGVALSNLAAGLALFVLLSFFEQIPGVQTTQVTVVKLAGVLLAVSWLVRLARRGSEAPLLLREHPFLAWSGIFFVGWALASQLWASDDEGALSTALRILQGFVLLLIVFSAVTERRHVWWLTWAFVGGALVTSAVGFTGAYAEEGRLSGDFSDPNSLGLILVPALGLASFGFAALGRRPQRWILAISVLIMGLALLLTETQGALVAVAVATPVGLLLAGPIRGWATAVVCIFVGLLLVFYALGTFRVLHQNVVEGDAGRRDIWKVAVEVVRDHPVNGVGAGNFPVVEPSYAANVSVERVDIVARDPHETHNTYLQILVEYGVIGLLTFVAFTGIALAGCWRAVGSFARAGDWAMEIIGRGLVVAVVGLLAAMIFLHGYHYKQFWILLGMLAALSSLERRRSDLGRSVARTQ